MIRRLVSPPPGSSRPVGPKWSRRIDRDRIGALAVLLGVVILALALRLVGLGWGRPFVYHPDEWVVGNQAIDMVRTGSWIPRWFTYPSGLIDVERLIVALLHHAYPNLSLDTSTTGGYAALPWRSLSNALPEQFPYWYAGRVFVAVVGALTALLTYLAARSVTNAVGGIAAAMAIAVAPLAVSNSHCLTTDVPMAALVALTLWLSLRGLTGRRSWLIAAGFAAGLAASTKYNGGLVIIVPFVVLLTSCPPAHLVRRPILVTACLTVAASIAGFALLTPALIVDPVSVWTGGILFQFQQYAGGHVGTEGPDSAIWYLRVLWGQTGLGPGQTGLGPGLSILTAGGIVVSVGRHRRADIAVLSFVIAYYAVIGIQSLRVERNLLPLLPFLAVLAGIGTGWLADFASAHVRTDRRQRRQTSSTAVALAVLALCVGPSLSAAVADDQALRVTDTRTIALDWIEQNIPAGATIAREEFTPQIPNSIFRVGFEWFLADKPLDWYRSNGFEYVVTSSSMFDRYMGIEPEGSFYRALLAEPVVLDLRPAPGQPGPRVVVIRLGAAAAAGGAP